ncbi:hypothetical protein [Paucibacter sp. KCTC 42545]|uniref:hypothetical protein n=1 Tax=Paucibacter sp. KCTC 42545 TaxID=1768242 RepID=UPI0012E34555|nr:hypothetical protein [Paucibacter sp. KCTC 42545]
MKIINSFLLPSILLTLLQAFDCAAAADTLSSPTGVATAQSTTTSPPAAPCATPLRQKTPSPKPEAPQRPPNPSISNVCAPVITIAPPPVAAAPSESQNQPELKHIPSPSSASSAVSGVKEAVEPPDTFKFKVKDLVEADLSSRSRVLVWALVAVFVAFGVIVLVGLKTVAKNTAKSSSSWFFAVIFILAAAVVTYFVVRMLAPHSLQDRTIEQLYFTSAEQRVGTGDAHASSQRLPLEHQRQLVSVKDEVIEVRRQNLMQQTDSAQRASTDSNGTSWSLIFLLLIIGFGLGYAFSKWRALNTSNSHAPAASQSEEATPAEWTVPLADAYFSPSRPPISAERGQRFRRRRTPFQADRGQRFKLIPDTPGARK